MATFKGKTWFLSDLHDGHANVIKFCNRPYRNVEEMHRAIFGKINELVRPEDTLYLLGDDIWNTCRPRVLEELNCNNIVCIWGNHSRDRAGYLRCRNVKGVYEEVILRIGGEDVRLSHYPYKYKGWKLFKAKIKQFLGISYEAKHLEKRPYDDGRWLLHGHTHSETKAVGRQIHVGWDAWHRPVNIQEIESMIQKGKNDENLHQN